jgi:eukaryotic-like serine/threonine-protein kinase
MTTDRTCPDCGAAISSQAAEGYCPSCLFALGLTPEPVPASAVPPADPLFPGAKLRYVGDYEILEQIAFGGMGTVFKARQMSLNRVVALKLMLPGQAASPQFVQRFRIEAEAAAGLDHPNIVPIYEVGEYEGQPYFSMRFVEGGTLAAQISNLKTDLSNPRRLRQVAVLVSTVARAVHHAHQRGVLHRDLKPGNILLDQQGEPHVADFGVAKLLAHDSGLTQSMAVIGSPSYMAPEQASGDFKHLTTAADVYGLGAILYELLAGRPVFRAPTPAETIRQVVEEDPVPPCSLQPGMDRDLQTICLKCLEKRPERRYSSAEAVAEDLERWLRHEPILASPVGALGKVWRWCQREPRLAGLAAAVLLLLMALSIGSTVAAWRINEAKNSEHLERERAERERDRAERAELETREKLRDALLAQATRLPANANTRFIRLIRR